MLANFVAIPDAKIAALARKGLVERIGAKHGSGGNLIPLSERCPALHIHIRLQTGVVPNKYILFDDAEIGDDNAGANMSFRVHASSRRNDCGRISGHKFVS